MCVKVKREREREVQIAERQVDKNSEDVKF